MRSRRLNFRLLTSAFCLFLAVGAVSADAPPPATQPATQPIETRTGSFQAAWPLPPKPDFLRRVDWLNGRFDNLMPKTDVETVRSKFALQPTYQLYVPADYAPGKPYGLIIWINSGDNGSVPDNWKKILDAHNLIWIGPDRVSNNELILWRLFMAFQALDNAKLYFTIDDARIYTAGVSGGGRSASDAALLGADLVDGGFFDVGVNFYKPVPVSTRPGYHWPGFYPGLSSSLLAKARRSDRFVMLSGTRDFNLENTRDTFKAYQADGFKFVTYFEVPDMGHGLCAPDWFDKAIVALDAPLAAAAEQAYRQAVAAEKAHRLGDACRNYASAAAHGHAQPWFQDAQAKSAALRHQFDQDCAAIDQLIADKQLDKALAATHALQSTWAAMSTDRCKQLFLSIAAARNSHG